MYGGPWSPRRSASYHMVTPQCAVPTGPWSPRRSASDHMVTPQCAVPPGPLESSKNYTHDMLRVISLLASAVAIMSVCLDV